MASILKTGLVLVLVAIVTVSATLYVSSTFLAPRQLERVSMSLGFAPFGGFAQYYAAKDLGFWEKYGLVVDVVGGIGSADAAKKVGIGSFEFAEITTNALIIARSEGFRIRAIGATKPNEGEIIVYRKDVIRTPKDLEGKVKAAFPGSGPDQFWPAMAKAVGIDPKSVKGVNAPPATIPILVAEKKADFWVTLYQAFLLSKFAAEARGVEVGYFLLRDYGVDTYGQVLVARDDYVKEKPRIVEAFLKGVYDAWLFSIENPEKAIDSLVKFNPQLDRARELASLKALIENEKPSIGARKGLPVGSFDLARFKKALELTNEYFGLKSVPKLEELYTTEFVGTR